MTRDEKILQSWEGKRLNTPVGIIKPYLLTPYFDDYFIEGFDDEGKRHRIRVYWQVVENLYHYGHATWHDGEKINTYTVEG